MVRHARNRGDLRRRGGAAMRGLTARERRVLIGAKFVADNPTFEAYTNDMESVLQLRARGLVVVRPGRGFWISKDGLLALRACTVTP